MFGEDPSSPRTALTDTLIAPARLLAPRTEECHAEMPVPLFLLVPPRLRVNGQNQAWPPNWRLQLLVHLACRADWVSRDDLQFLFWPDSAPVSAQGSLRWVRAEYAGPRGRV